MPIPESLLCGCALLGLVACQGQRTANASIALEVELTPRSVSWADLLAAGHDERWTLPASPSQCGCLRSQIGALLAARSEPVDGHTRSFGDYLAEFRELRADAGAREARLAELAFEVPEFWAQAGPTLEALVREDEWLDKDWKSSRESSLDGFMMGPTWDLDDEALPFWEALGGRHEIEQAATVIWADGATIKSTENDYAELWREGRGKYEELHVVPELLFSGTDAEGQPFRSLTLDFRRDLPFPFTSYHCRMHLLTRPGPDGTLLTDCYSTSRDFYWFAARDVLFPVFTSNGAPVATLAVRVCGFDLRGVPDQAHHVRRALRTGLGDLKRRAERRAQNPRGRAPGPAWPEPAVRVLR